MLARLPPVEDTIDAEDLMIGDVLRIVEDLIVVERAIVVFGETTARELALVRASSQGQGSTECRGQSYCHRCGGEQGCGEI